ncbi:MAG: IS110 family transposase [Gemmatimonadales bacterium]|nr:IS110 family transposase [Gemmatimonadales bacterium]NIN12287.1 IS110 family transposase [Gemmatimonadales bacterium]NIN50748.1 IS110 family transposase [Gemmatimonadales bacterium]NIP08212.1 IS110 family transposase [Gemmatimonadales bacterium]NIR02093.1 IS110 family transposase [Gemmatimonadales bacterium]
MPTPRITVGLDLGDRHSQFCLVDENSGVVEEGRLRTTSVALHREFAERPPMRIVIEVGTHSPWVSRLLEHCGHEVLVANARKIRLIFVNDNKNDRIDAESLARVGRLDPQLLCPIRHRGAQAQVDLATLRSRDSLVRARTQLINHVRGAVKAVGGRLPRSSAPAFPRKVAEHIPAELRTTLNPVLEMIGRLSCEIRAADRRVERLAAERYPETERLKQVAGVGPITSLCFVLTLEDPTRFPNSRAVGAYLGMRPKRRDSGARSPQLRISKRGDTMLRRLLVGSAQYILGPFGPDCDLQRWGLRLAQRGGKNAKKRAVVAVARKLSCMLHSLWINGTEYEPFRSEKAKTAAA